MQSRKVPWQAASQGTKKVLWVSRALVPISSQPTPLRTARTSAFLPRWLPSHTAHHLPHWHRPDGHLTWKDSSEPTNRVCTRGGESCSFGGVGGQIWLPGTQALLPPSAGTAPGQPLLESCPRSTRLRYMKIKHQPVQGPPGTLLRGSYKSCQHG